MLYKLSYSVPADTAETAKDWQKMQISQGRIKEWWIWMPRKASNQLHLTIHYHGSQIMPFSPDHNIYAWFNPPAFLDDYPINDPPYVLDVYSWNTDADFDHEYNIHVVVMPPEQPTETVYRTSWYDRLGRFIGWR